MIRSDGSKGWKCENCNVYFRGGHHTTKALAHISLSKFPGIKHCSGKISPESLGLYKRIHTIRSEKRDAKAQTRATIMRAMKDGHGSGLASLASFPGKKQAKLKKQLLNYDPSIGSGGSGHSWMPPLVISTIR